MKKTFVVLVALALLVSAAMPVRAQGIRAAEPFKLGTFSNNGQQFRRDRAARSFRRRA